MEYTRLDDEALIGFVQQNQEAALSVLYDRYGRLVYSMAFNALQDQALAEEITQDVFLRVWNKAETFRAEQGKVVTWITSIARYRAIDVIRRRNVRPEGNRATWVDDPGFELPDALNVEAEVEASDSSRQIRRAMAQLPDEQRLVLAYAYFQGYTHSQIANALGEPLGTIKTRIRLAMQKLRQLLQEVDHL
ncbi:MAG TPA: sigma-70 family RNA polymerase sigma factor [Anaerolineales bacterium]|nr:sigma-70 family RNA polymerase sigma factor [Anaerolineales bacterium]